jgi:predicted kinase
MRRVFVITGPPAAGKTTWMREKAKPGDITIDFDDIAAVLSPGLPRDPLDMPASIMAVARAARLAAIDQALFSDSHTGDVYIIDARPRRAAMQKYAEVGAEIIVVDPGAAECLRRARAERTPRQQELAQAWYRVRNLL